MPNFQAAFKAEITRIARKEVRQATADVKKSSSSHRAQIAALKREVGDLRRALKQALRTGRAPAAAATSQAEEAEGVQHRFRVAGFANLRKRLELSAQQMGALIGVTGQTVYKWEKGEAKPRAAQLAAIAAVRGLSHRQAREKLAQGPAAQAAKPARRAAAKPERASAARKKPVGARAARAETAPPRRRRAA